MINSENKQISFAYQRMAFAGLQKSSTIDFPGRLSAVVFTRGCDLDCFFCHNREILSNRAPLLDEGELWAFLEKRSGLLDGVVISGGEPTLQGGLPHFCQKAKALGYAIKLDTNGGRPRIVDELIQNSLIDYLAVDIKALREDYAAIAGKPGFDAALETLSIAASAGLPHEARTTVFPGMDEASLLKIAQSMPKMPLWRLNVYRVPGLYKPDDEQRIKAPALTERRLEELLPSFWKYQPNATL